MKSVAPERKHLCVQEHVYGEKHLDNWPDYELLSHIYSSHRYCLNKILCCCTLPDWKIKMSSSVWPTELGPHLTWMVKFRILCSVWNAVWCLGFIQSFWSELASSGMLMDSKSYQPPCHESTHTIQYQMHSNPLTIDFQYLNDLKLPRSMAFLVCI